MGASCSYQKVITPTASDLVSLKPGDQRIIVGSCSTTSVTNKASCPPEFKKVFAPDSGCDTDTLDPGAVFDCVGDNGAGATCGTGGDTGHCEVRGKQTACQRLDGGAGYQADPVACCKSQGTLTIGNLTCDPIYRDPNGTACKNILYSQCASTTQSPWDVPTCKAIMDTNVAASNYFKGTYCAVGDRAYFDANCLNWLKTNPTSDAVKTIILNKCNTTNLHREPCQSYIKDRSKQSSEFDALMTSYCKGGYKNKQLCACINSADSYANDKDYVDYCRDNPNVKGCNCLSLSFDADGRIPSKPVCLDPKCATPQTCNDGVEPFKTFSMNSDTCNYVQCKQIIDMMGVTQIGDGSNTVNVTQALNCGISPDAIASYNKKITDKNGTTETSGTNLGGDGSTTTVVDHSTKPENGNIVLYVLLFVLILAIVAGIAYKVKVLNAKPQNVSHSGSKKKNKSNP